MRTAFLPVALTAPLATFAANVTVNVTSNLFPVATPAYGMHVSVYANEIGNANLPGRFIESGVNFLRYPGGGYSDGFHWSINKLSPWWGVTNSSGYQGPNSDFGSFAKLLTNAQSQAIITVNTGAGQLWNAGHTALTVPPSNGEPKEAAAWVAYANGSASLFGTTNDITIGTDSLSNNWRTVGFWAKLRASSQSQYQSWATAAGVYSSDFDFLAISNPAPIGIKYWEIGNECFGTGYYSPGTDGYALNYAVPYPYTTYPRYGNPALSPAAYGQQVNQFSLAMKAVDPTVKIGAVVSTPLDDYGWDVYAGQHWTPQVLSQCASNIDFIIAHWYPGNGADDNGNGLLPLPAAKIPSMVNGTNTHAGTNSGLKDWINQYRPGDPTNVEVFITEFGYTGNVVLSTNGLPILGPVNALYDVDAYATFMRNGVANICFLEMISDAFVGGSSSLTRGETFYGLKLLHEMARPGDMMVNATSDTSNLRVHATRQQSGKVGLLLMNQSLTSTQTVSVVISNVTLTGAGTRYTFGRSNFVTNQEVQTSGPSTNTLSGVTNTFSVTIAPHTMMVYTLASSALPTATTLELASSANPSTYDNPVTFTATIKTNGVALTGISGQTITFYNSATSLGTGTLNGSGQAGLTTSATQLLAGVRSITAVYGGDSSYLASSNLPALLQTVTQAVLTAGLTGSVIKTYNGSKAAALTAGNYTLSGIVSGDSVALNNPTSGSYNNRNAGTGKTVIVSGLSISGASVANYVLATNAVSAAIGTINPTNMTVTAAANTKNYDSSTASATLPTITSGVVQPSDSAAFTQSYADANVGTGKTLIPTGLVNDNNGGSNYNYTFVPNATGTINPLPASIASGVAANDKIYDGNTTATLNFTNVTLSGILTADTNNVTVSTGGHTATFAVPDVGTGISVTVTGLTLAGSAAGNYALNQPTGLTADILPLQEPTIITIAVGSITFSGPSGQNYRVLGSSEMTLPVEQWSELTNGTFGASPVTFTEAFGNPSPTNRFYRVGSP